MTEELNNEEQVPAKGKQYRNTVGSIVGWAIFRSAIVIFGAMFLYEYVAWVDYGLWWGVTLISIYAFVIHPMQVQYRLFREETKNVVEGTLCSTCRHFDENGILCLKLDEHVAEDYIPCEGEQWEPK